MRPKKNKVKVWVVDTHHDVIGDVIKVDLDEIEDLSDLRKAVHVEMTQHLSHCDAVDLNVCVGATVDENDQVQSVDDTKIITRGRTAVKELGLQAGGEVVMMAPASPLIDQQMAQLSLQPSAPSALIAFWSALPNVKEEDGFLTLPDGVWWLGDEEIGSTMLVRQCYRDMFDYIVGDMNNNLKAHVVTGTPGIGKTLFVGYVLWRLASLGQQCPKVLWWMTDKARKSAEWLFESTGIRDCGSLPRKDWWYIVDGRRPGGEKLGSRSLLVTSPQEKVYKSFRKFNGAILRYMPTWSMEELNMFAYKWRPELLQNDEGTDATEGMDSGDQNEDGSMSDIRSMSILCKRFDLVGGVARYVFLPEEYPLADLCDVLDKAAQQLSPTASELRRLIGTGVTCTGTDAGPHRLLHVHPKPNTSFKRDFVEPASAYAARLIVERYFDAALTQATVWLQIYEDIPAYASTRGTLFETYAHGCVFRGGSFSMKRLRGEGEAGEQQLPRFTQRQYADSLSAETLKNGCYYIPTARNHPAYDSWAVVECELWLFQMTVSDRHSVVAKAIESASNVVSMCNNVNEIRLVFVVPMEILQKWNSPQPFVRNGKRLYDDSICVQQYVMGLSTAVRYDLSGT